MSKKEIENSLRLIRSTGKKRANERFPFQRDVTITHKGETVKGYSLNISVGGIFLTFDGSIDYGDIVQIGFDLPGVENINVSGEIRWLLPHANGLVGCGIKFLTLPDMAMRALVSLATNEELQDL